jgi:hypothetical protein
MQVWARLGTLVEQQPPHHQAGRLVCHLDGDGVGYEVFGDGYPWPLGGAPRVIPTGYWPGQDLARGIVVRSDGASGYVADAYGGIHPFGAAPSPITYCAGCHWQNWDVIRGIVLRGDGRSGYVVELYGGVHPFCAGQGCKLPPVPPLTWYQTKGDLARGITLRSDASGYVLDAYGGIHGFGGAPGVTCPGCYHQGWDIYRGIVLPSPSCGSGYIVDGFGGIHDFAASGCNPLPIAARYGYWAPQDEARGIVLVNCGSWCIGGYVVNGNDSLLYWFSN